VENLKEASLGYAPVLPSNIRLRWKGLPRTNTLNYCENLLIKYIKRFVALGFNSQSKTYFVTDGKSKQAESIFYYYLSRAP